jgi:hypothetical protein
MFNESGINNRNISYQSKDREEFIEEFLRKKGNTNNSYISSPNIIYPIRQRWNYLYNLNKLYKTKLQDKREQQRLITEEQEMKECTFIPQLYKKLSYVSKNNDKKQNHSNTKVLKNKDNEKNSNINLDLIERQNAWIKKKNEEINKKIKKQQKEQMEECFFTPEINNDNPVIKAKMKTKTTTLLEDPESYSLYIRRLQRKREQTEKEKRNERSRPGSGNIWKKKRSGNNKNKSYDYKKINYSGLMSGSKSNKNEFNTINKNNLFNNSNSHINEENTLETLSKRIKSGEVDKNHLYEDLYKKTVDKLNDPYGKMSENNDDNNEKIEFSEQESIYNQPIEYGKAIDILHNKLFSINLDNDEDDE